MVALPFKSFKPLMNLFSGTPFSTASSPEPVSSSKTVFFSVDWARPFSLSHSRARRKASSFKPVFLVSASKDWLFSSSPAKALSSMALSSSTIFFKSMSLTQRFRHSTINALTFK